jgi:protoheme IX farnesyltransferase
MSSVPTSVPPASAPRAAGRLGAAAGVYAELTKARLSALVVATTAAGYALGSSGRFDLTGLVWAVLGTSLSALGANGLNQWLERARDARMERTRDRPLPSGRLEPGRAFAVSLALALFGTAALFAGTNALTAGLNVLTVALYVLVYTPLKTRSSLCTLVGAIVGAIPPVMGYAAAAGTIGAGAWILFAVLFAWQIPHFLSLAWLYREDYRRGGYIMLPLGDPTGRITFEVTMLYALALVPLGLASFLAGLTGWVSVIGSLALGGVFFALTLQLRRRRGDREARRVFLASLAYLPLLLGLFVADHALR